MDEHDEQLCNTNLGLGLNHYGPETNYPAKKTKRVFFGDLSFPLHSSDDLGNTDSSSSLKIIRKFEKQRSKEDEDDGHEDDNYSRNCGRKKLRLSKDQISLLEDSFKQQSTPNTIHKQGLAKILNLKPKQVEVWFQNRRARTKLKQTEVDCNFLKKNCQNLSEENRRLKKELFELRSAMKMEEQPPPSSPPFLLHNPKLAKVKTCPSCENKNVKNRGGGGSNKEAAAAAAAMVAVHEPKAN